jgi:transcription-repair coupling factor (superfamily II helicase)
VLYLYNKVETISFVADKISHAFPDARVAYAHGQMEKDELEDVWQLLIRGEIDILVCTTIIETGVDLPTANTLIIENADKFGLSQLHQIRGRVGRAEGQAYAYLTYRAGKALSEVARKRLEAIKQYAEFGAGFKIALCDLEIRGAGNLLGAEQHGYIDMIGYDLYVKILAEAVKEARGEVTEKREEALIDLKVNAHIPEYYIPTTAHRIEMYKKISHIDGEEDALDLCDEFLDRFGDMPRPVSRLVEVALIKALATRAGITKITTDKGNLVFIFKTPSLENWASAFAEFPALRFAPSADRVIYRLTEGEISEVCAKILKAYFKDENEEKEKKK